MDRRETELSPRSRRVLAQGRHIASHLGATLYAVAAENRDDNDTWIAQAGLCGADKIVLLSFAALSEESPEPKSPSRPGLLAASIMSVCDALHPNLVLLDNDRLGTMISPALAHHLAAQLLTGAVPHCTEDGDMILEQRSPDRRTRRQLSVTKCQAPVVATLSAAGVKATKGQDDADVIFFKAPRYPVTLPSVVPSVIERLLPDPGLDSEIVVCAGLGAKEKLAEVRELASALGAPLVFTKSLGEELRISGAEDLCPVVDRGAHRIAPTLYLACGADGTDSHLGAIAGGTTIVSLGREPSCPSVLASRYACVGSLEETLPALTQAIHNPASLGDVSADPIARMPTPVQSSKLMAFTPCPDSVELFSDPRALLQRLQQDGLWTP